MSNVRGRTTVAFTLAVALTAATLTTSVPPPAVAQAPISAAPGGQVQALSAATAPWSVERLSGTDRYQTAASVATSTFQPGASMAFVASGEEFADALAAGAVAGVAGAPLLLTGSDILPAATRDAIEKLGVQTVVVVGGRRVVSDAVMQELDTAVEGPVTRIGGDDRYDTAAQLADRVGTAAGGTVIIATGLDFADGLAGAVLAADRDAPILLATPDALPAPTRQALMDRVPDEVILLGGEAALSNGVAAQIDTIAGTVSRLSGRDRYGTAAAVADAVGGPLGGTAWLASGVEFPDALAGAAAAASTGAPLLLAAPTCQPDATYAALSGQNPALLKVLGGVAALHTSAALPVSCDQVETSVVARDLDTPWDMAVTSDGVYITESNRGRVSRIGADGRRTTVKSFPVNPAGEGGLLGLAASPDYDQDGWLYTYRTTANDNEVLRFNSGGAVETILDGIPAAGNHNGGRIAFGPDGMLYVGTGDAAMPTLAQDRGSLAGKILRLTPEGDVPDDNPFPDSPVWSLGHRNVQGLAWAEDKTMFASEFGPDRDDEINRIVPGGNYGWPSVTGVAGRAGFRDPVVVRQPSVASWSGLTILQDGQVTEWEGHLFAAALRGRRLWDLDPTGAATTERLVGEFGRLRHVARAPDGALWVLTHNTDGRGTPAADDDRILRIGRPRHDANLY